jgi:hypothetical protein
MIKIRMSLNCFPRFFATAASPTISDKSARSLIRILENFLAMDELLRIKDIPTSANF